jgi:hypothetical protein
MDCKDGYAPDGHSPVFFAILHETSNIYQYIHRQTAGSEHEGGRHAPRCPPMMLCLSKEVAAIAVRVLWIMTFCCIILSFLVMYVASLLPALLTLLFATFATLAKRVKRLYPILYTAAWLSIAYQLYQFFSAVTNAHPPAS